MVEFGSGYSMPMDREFSHQGHAHEESGAPSDGSTNDIGVGIGDMGMSLGLGPVPNVQAIKSKLYAGGKKLEFVFTGMGKGSGQGQTPEMYGLKQRQALTEIAAANRVDFTTHATVGVYGLAGMDQQGNFSKQSKNFSLQEIKRAIEFAADVGRGGPVVVHTGEFQRPIVDADWNKENDPWFGKFKMYEDEEERYTYRVVDSRTGGVIQEARKNRKVSRPVWNRYDENNDSWQEHDGKEYLDSAGHKVKPGDYLDYFGNRLDPEKRVPRYDQEKGTFMVDQLDWDDLKKEAIEMTERAKEVYRDWKAGKMSEEEFKKSYWTRFKDAPSESEIKVRPEEAYIISTLETNAANSRGWAHYYGSGFNEAIDSIKKLRKAYQFYKELEEATDEEEKWKLKKEIDTQGFRGLVPVDSKYPSDIVKEMLIRQEGHMKQAQEASASQWSQADESMETIRHVESAETYAFKEACESYAQAALTAMMHTDKLAKEGKLKKSLSIAMENLFPETYGSHPDELKELVSGSRDKFAELLKQRGMSQQEAQNKAHEHITATLDTGHINMWRKYWQGDPKKTMSENDEEYNKWMLSKIGDLTRSGIIGHVHLDDNYGYQDDHLAPGEGNAPIREMVKTLKANGYKGELIIEPGADYTTDVSGFHSVMKTWRNFGTPVYGTGSGGGGGGGKRRTWNEVGYGFFGQNQPPYFVFGAYSPSEDWTLWSGVPLE